MADDATPQAPDDRLRLRTTLRRRLVAILLGILAFNLVIPPYVVPTDGEITSRFFLRTRPESSFALAIEAHKGIDFAAPIGTPVRASKSGIVSEVGWSDTLGRFVEIDHWLGFSTRYAHLSATSVREGQLVLKWQRIGAVGQTGRATGPHLHFEVAFLGRQLPPSIFLLIDSGRRSLLRAVAPTLLQ